MPSLTRISRLARVATLPETRHLIVAAARSDTLRDVAWRAANDRAGLTRDLRNPATTGNLIRDSIRHPAVRELASAGVMFLPLRFVPLGWATTWVAHRVLRRHAHPPTRRTASGTVPPTRDGTTRR